MVEVVEEKRSMESEYSSGSLDLATSSTKLRMKEVRERDWGGEKRSNGSHIMTNL